MDFTFENPLWTFSQKENPSWAGNIYQKIEKMCANKIVQVPSKYVDMFSEHVRMFLDEVDELLDPASNRDKGTDFVKSIDNDSKIVPCKESSERFGESTLNESTICAIEEPVISSVEDMTLVTPHDVAQDTLSNGHEKEQIATKVTDSSCTGVDGNCRKIADEVASSAGIASALSANEVLPSETHKSVVLEEGFMLSGNSTPVEICSTSTSWDMTSLVRSLGNEWEHKFKPNESEADVQLPESASAIEEPVISSMEDTKLVTPLDIAQDTLNNEHEKEQIPTEATDSSGTGVDGNYRKITDEVASSGGITNALSANEVPPSESHKSVVLEEGFMLSGNSTPAEICGTSTSWDMTSLVQSLGNEREQKFEPNGSEVDVQLPESAVSEISDLPGWEDMFNSTDRADLSTGLGEFEDVDLQDSWDDDDDEDYELALVSYQDFKNRSCKRKLRAAIISKLRPSKDYGQVAYWHHDTNKGMQDGRGITESSVLKASSIHDSSEPDWEFL